MITNMHKKRSKGRSVEEKVRRRVRKNALRNAVLVSAYLAVAAGVMIMMPNAMKLLKTVEKAVGPSPRLKRRISQKYSELIAQNIFERVYTANGSRIVLTEKGKELAEGLSLKEQLRLAKPRRWDHKWRIIMFDIWERRRRVRDQLRGSLEEVGFVKIQNSVWMYPYPCEALLIFLRKSLRLGRGILYMVVDEIEDDESLRRHFKLPCE